MLPWARSARPAWLVRRAATILGWKGQRGQGPRPQGLERSRYPNGHRVEEKQSAVAAKLGQQNHTVHRRFDESKVDVAQAVPLPFLHSGPFRAPQPDSEL